MNLLDAPLNILGIYDTIYGASLPVGVPSIRLIIQLQSEPHDRGTTRSVTIRMIDDQGSDLLPHPLQCLIMPRELPPRVNRPQVVELNGVSFEEYGEYARERKEREARKAKEQDSDAT